LLSAVMVCGSVAAAEPASVAVRYGRHEGFSRIVFDWPERVSYRLERTDAGVTVVFDRPARFAVGRPGAAGLPHIVGLTSGSPDAAAASVVIATRGATRIRDSRLGTKVVIDVVGGGDPSAGDATAAAPPAVAAGTPEAEAGDSAPRPRPEPATKKRRRRPPSPTDVTTAGEDAAPKPATTSPVTPPAPAPVVSEHGARPSAAPSPPPSRPSETAPRPPSAPEPTVDGPAPTVATPSPAAASTVASSPSTDASRPTDPVLLFRWREPVAAAVFQRAGHVWVVFDKAMAQDAAAIGTASGGRLREVRHIPSRWGTFLRLTPVGAIAPVVRRDGFNWLIELRDTPPPATAGLVPEVQLETPIGPRLWLPAAAPSEPIAVADPDVGDILVVVPVRNGGTAVPYDYGFPEVTVLATIQGLVLAPRVDHLRVHSLGNGVEVSAADGMTLAAMSDDQRALAPLRDGARPRAVLDRTQWRDPRDSDFDRLRRDLSAVAGGIVDGDGSAARFALAQLLLGAGLTAETIGTLDRLVDERSESANDPRLRLMRGVARLLLGRGAEAGEDLGHPSLATAAEARLWRALLETDRDAVADKADVAPFVAFIADYPPPLRRPALVLAVRALIAAGDAPAARRAFDALRAPGTGLGHDAMLAYLEGRILDLEGDTDAAVARWQEAEQGRDRLARLRSALARVDVQLARGTITKGQARQELEALRLSWHGDHDEFVLLDRLGRLALDDGDVAAGLRLLRQATTLYPQHPRAAQSTSLMTDAFVRLYRDGGSEALSPLTAIALFDEFRDVNPPGAEGDAISLRLAERLIAVDLLDRAAALLQDQIGRRAAGAERDRIALRLAHVHMLDHAPAESLRVLDTAFGESVVDPVATARRHLRAQALIELDRGDEALRQLETDDGPDAWTLRARLHLRQRDWRQAADALGAALTAAGARPGSPLDHHQARTVLNQAVALRLLADGEKVELLRRSHGAAMAASPFADAFRLVAGGGGELEDRRALARLAVEEVSGFRTFLSAYGD
jgi:predicted negative regulator of RcsB-dependent stress response